MKLIYPFINIIAVALVSILSVLSIVLAEKTIGLHTIYRIGDIEAFVFTLLYGGLIFNYLAKKFLNKNSDNQSSTLKQHLQQSVGLYLICLFVLIQDLTGEGLEVAYWLMIGFVAVVGIVTNFVTIKVR